MGDVDEVVTESSELEEHIDAYKRPFIIEINDGSGVDIIKEFRELDDVDLQYRDFKTWEIDPASETNGQTPTTPDTPSVEEDEESTKSELRLRPQTIRILFAILSIALLTSWAVICWLLFPEFIRANSPLLTLLGLLVGGLSLGSMRYIL